MEGGVKVLWCGSHLVGGRVLWALVYQYSGPVCAVNLAKNRFSPSFLCAFWYSTLAEAQGSEFRGSIQLYW